MRRACWSRTASRSPSGLPIPRSVSARPAKGRAQLVEWRGTLANPTSYVAQQARAADMIITGTNRDGWALDPARRLDPSALVMQVGRPVFFVPPEVERLNLTTALVAWKDTREARRAVWDALPLLQKAKEVTVAEVVEDEEGRGAARNRVDDVAGWLARHGVIADAIVPEAIGNAGEQLRSDRQRYRRRPCRRRRLRPRATW